MESVIVAAAVVATAAIVAAVIERRGPAPPTQAMTTTGTWAVPTQLDRADFASPQAPWLVAVFTSATCDSCVETLQKARLLASDAVAVEEVEAQASADRHRRYRIDAVPITVVADAEGVVRASFVGPPSTTDLWAAVAEVRQQDG